MPFIRVRQLEVCHRRRLLYQAAEAQADTLSLPVLLQHARDSEEESVHAVISDFRQRRDFTVEVETTPACGMDCPWCENRKSKPFGSFADDNVCFEKLLKFLALA